MMYYGSESDNSSKDPPRVSINTTYQYARWEFQPAPWLSYKAFVTEATFLIRCGNELNQPTLTPTLTASFNLSKEHPV
ncbi:hypothetical protein K440DRAFT_178774 [Wilcoxina mikolae CBS 423.85]|nr:hypothetical protein K440DRAFT_178774 [Wilcoxina mikolae CBS 423.85]